MYTVSGNVVVVFESTWIFVTMLVAIKRLLLVVVGNLTDWCAVVVSENL